MNTRREIQLVQLHLEEAYNHFNTIVAAWEAEVEAEIRANQAAQMAQQRKQETPETAIEDYEEKQDFLRWKKTQNLGQTKTKIAPKYEEFSDEAQELSAEEMKEMQKTKRVL